MYFNNFLFNIFESFAIERYSKNHVQIVKIQSAKGATIEKKDVHRGSPGLGWNTKTVGSSICLSSLSPIFLYLFILFFYQKKVIAGLERFEWLITCIPVKKTFFQVVENSPQNLHMLIVYQETLNFQ